MDLTDKIFATNASNLVSSIEQTNPLVIKFRNQHSMIRGDSPKYFSTTAWATFCEQHETVKIDLVVKTGLNYYMIYGVLILCLIGSIFSNRLLSSLLPLMFSLVIFAAMDLYAKKSILRRVEKLLLSI